MNRERVAPAGRRLGRQILLARLALFWERVWPAAWPLLAVAGLFLVVSLFAVWAWLSPFLHALGLGLFAVAALRAAVPLVRAARWPARHEALARMERDSGLGHRPLRALEEELAAGRDDPVAEALWEGHRRRLLGLLGKTRVRAPRSLLPVLDRWALRAALLLALVLGFVEAGDDAGRRISGAFVPAFAGPAAVAAPTFEFWVAPPAYTRIAPFRVEPSGGERTAAVEVPAGSEFVAQVHHAPEAGRGFLLAAGGAELDFAPIGGDSAEARFVVEEDGEVVVRRGEEEHVRLGLLVRPDRPPVVSFLGPPEVTARRTLDIRFEAVDDYAVSEVALRIVPPEVGDEPGGEVERRVLLRGGRDPQRLDGRSFLDLTAHPRAGLPVILQLEARDGRGQTGLGGGLEMVLPERIFTHPLARAVIAQRKALVERPDRWALVAIRLQRLAESTEAAELGTTVPLSLFVASSRLVRDRTPDGRRSVVDLLWEIALLIEEGGLSLAERQLRELQEQLQQALAENAPDEELQRLLDELQAALERYLDELARRAMEQFAEQLRRGEQPTTVPMDPSRMVDRDQLREMLERARELARSGMRDAAREMLAQLQQLLENLQAGIPQPMQQVPGEQELSDLQRMIQLQQQLLERSFEMDRAMRNGMPRQGPMQPGEQGDPQQGQGLPQASEQAAAEQEALRRALGELMRRLGEAGFDLPRALGNAELQMRSARDALGRGQPGEATDPQTRALDQMRQAGQALLEQMREQMAQQPGPGQLPGGFQRPGRDPLGRAVRNEGGFQTEGVEIPEDYDLGRARGVLEELYRRSGDRRRPAYELDYYDRLLDRF